MYALVCTPWGAGIPALIDRLSENTTQTEHASCAPQRAWDRCWVRGDRARQRAIYREQAPRFWPEARAALATTSLSWAEHRKEVRCCLLGPPWQLALVSKAYIANSWIFYLLGETNIQDPTVCNSSNCHFVHIHDIWARASSKLPIKTPQKTGMPTLRHKASTGFPLF